MNNRPFIYGFTISLLIHGSLGIYGVYINNAVLQNSYHKKVVPVGITKEPLKNKLINEILKTEQDAAKQGFLNRMEDIKKTEETPPLLKKSDRQKIPQKKIPEVKASQKIASKEKPIPPKGEEIEKQSDPTHDMPLSVKPQALVLKNVSLSGSVEVEVAEQSTLMGDATISGALQKGQEKTYKNYQKDTGLGGAMDGSGSLKKPVIVPPQPQNDVKGLYPPEMKEFNKIVEIVLKLSISKEGKITDITVIKGYNEYFEREAIVAVKKIIFKPATRDNIPIPFTIVWKVLFIPEG